MSFLLMSSENARQGDKEHNREAQIPYPFPIGQVNKVWHSPPAFEQIKRERLAFLFYRFAIERFAYSHWYIVLS